MALVSRKYNILKRSSLNARAAYELAAGTEDVETANATGALTISLSRGRAKVYTLTGAVTSVTVSGARASAGDTLRLFLVQDATGSRLVTWGASFKFAGGTAPTLSTAAGKVDFVQFYTNDGTTWYCIDSVLDLR